MKYSYFILSDGSLDVYKVPTKLADKFKAYYKTAFKVTEVLLKEVKWTI